MEIFGFKLNICNSYILYFSSEYKHKSIISLVREAFTLGSIIISKGRGIPLHQLSIANYVYTTYIQSSILGLKHMDYGTNKLGFQKNIEKGKPSKDGERSEKKGRLQPQP